MGESRTSRNSADLDLPPHWEVPAFEVHEFAVRQTRYAIGIPVINEGARIGRQLEEMQGLGLHRVSDIVIADGGSSDGSVDTSRLASLGVRTLLMKTGPGKLSAQLRMFFAYVPRDGYDGTVIIDGNGKDGVEAIPSFVRALDQGWDYLQGSRYIPGGIEENTPLARKLGVKGVHAPLLSLCAGFRYSDTTNGFRAVSKRPLEDERLQTFRSVFDTYNLHYYLSHMAPRLGYRVKELPVKRVYPKSEPVPSKVKGLKAYGHVMVLVIKTALGTYDPPPRSR